MNNKSVIGFTIFIGIVIGLIFLGVIDKDPYQEEREIANPKHKIVAALEERIKLIDEVVYHIHRLDGFFGEREDSVQVLESCEKEKTATKELLEEIMDDHPIEQEQFDIKKLEKSNAELAEVLNELRSFSEDENDLKKGRKITI